MRDAGHIDVDLTLAGGRIDAVRLVSTRPRGMARGLIGRPGTEVPHLLALLFPMCRMAHAIASASAIEAASGHAPNAGTRRARGMAIVAERFEALAWRFGMDAAVLLGRPEDMGSVAAVRRAADAFRRLVDPASVVAKPFAIVESADAGALDAAYDVLKQALRRFAATDGVLSMLEGLAVAFEARGLGAHPLPLTPARDPAWYDRRFIEDPTFSDRPTLACGPAEVGPLAARGAADGSTLVARITAQIDALGQEPRTLGHLIDEDASAPVPLVAISAPGIATAVVETTRGPLAYRVEMAGERVHSLMASAPTEWNFHPAGPFVATLRGATADGDAEAYARFLAFSFDPCVPLVVRTSATTREALHA